jgi:molybdenum cofactor guanylyltransferase
MIRDSNSGIPRMPTPPVDRREDGFVLAGGQSSRMGTDKALASFKGVPLIQNALQILSEAGFRTQIAGSRTSLSRFAKEIPDTYLDAGPLAGIHAALSASTTEWNAFLPVDVPLLPSSLLVCLFQRATLTGAPVTICKLNGRLQPFPVILKRTVLPLIEQRLESGQNSCHAAWQSMAATLACDLGPIPVEYLVQCGQCAHPLSLPPVFWFESANTPVELARLNYLPVDRRRFSSKLGT